jgi:hypothetical protein
LRSSGSNLYDAALAILDTGIEHAGNIIPPGLGAVGEGGQILEPGSIDDLDANAILAKIGRTTGYSEGIYSAVIDSIAVKADVNNENISITFSNVIEVEWKDENSPFTKPGDSGSLVYTRDQLRAVGLHFAGGITEDVDKKTRRGVSYCCDLVPIFAKWNLALL